MPRCRSLPVVAPGRDLKPSRRSHAFIFCNSGVRNPGVQHPKQPSCSASIEKSCCGVSSFGLSLRPDPGPSTGHRPQLKTYLVMKRKIRQFLPGTADIKRIFSFRAGVHRRNQPHRCTHAVLQIRQVYVEKVIIADVAPDAIVVMDNLSSHKEPRVRQMIEAAGARLLYLPPYSPGFNPIENAFAKLKPFLRRGRKTNRSRPLERDWSHHRNRMPQLLHRRRIRCNMIGGCSAVQKEEAAGQEAEAPVRRRSQSRERGVSTRPTDAETVSRSLRCGDAASVANGVALGTQRENAALSDASRGRGSTCFGRLRARRLLTASRIQLVGPAKSLPASSCRTQWQH
ncbi:hypothetical protein CVM73_30985 [Bradyrhizobium forestalis]|uniref:Tc1-like transposase DDE domain-containing protein n=1 Tax=Bradyrhizobium forestalis TaxID=1419263 RepID=A0A2M8R0N8_9BRAD|nr:hypothetical protein CVM73_30985 [Bradyrhizobium forestalis]